MATAVSNASPLIHLGAIGNFGLAKSLRQLLDDGEAEAVALAVQEKPDIVLLDESEARKAAEVHGLTKTGVIGLLVRARREGKLASVKDRFDCLRDEGGFWIDSVLYQSVLKAVGEL